MAALGEAERNRNPASAIIMRNKIGGGGDMSGIDREALCLKESVACSIEIE